MIDNEVIKEVRRARDEVMKDHDDDLQKLMSSLVESQKTRPNLVASPSKTIHSLTEDKPSTPYNTKN